MKLFPNPSVENNNFQRTFAESKSVHGHCVFEVWRRGLSMGVDFSLTLLHPSPSAQWPDSALGLWCVKHTHAHACAHPQTTCTHFHSVSVYARMCKKPLFILEGYLMENESHINSAAMHIYTHTHTHTQCRLRTFVYVYFLFCVKGAGAWE